MKGKVNLAMSHGLPVVATSVAIEGMHLTDGDDVLVADDPRAFADAVLRAYDDEALWQRLSDGRAARTSSAIFRADVQRRAALVRALRDVGIASAGRFVNSRSNTAWPRAMPRCSNFVSGRHAGRGANPSAVLAQQRLGREHGEDLLGIRLPVGRDVQVTAVRRAVRRARARTAACSSRRLW